MNDTSNKLFKIALCQMKVRPNKKLNLERAKELISTAVDLYKAQVVVLPEMFNTPLGLPFVEEYAEIESSSETLNFLSEISKEKNIYLIGGSIVEKDGNDYYNTCYCFNKNGEIKAKHRKLHLFDIDIPGRITYKESNKYGYGKNFTVFETEFCKFGIGICYDIRFPEYAQLLKQEHGVKFLVYPAAFNTITGPMHWELLSRSRALDNNVFLAMCSPSRNYESPDTYQCYGYSTVVSPFGSIIANTTYEEDIVVSNIDLNLVDDITQQIPTFKQKRSDLYKVNKV
jgi:omega-amidase